MRLAIAKAAAHGVAAVAVRNSGHFGAAGSYAALATRAGLIGIATTDTRIPSLVPTSARDAALGTNPIAFAAPAAGQEPFLLDMATSTAPLGRLGVAAHRGRRVPRGWALDPRGRAETNARRAIAARRLTPLGGSLLHGSHKGYGLATMVEILSRVLPDTARGADDVARVGHFFLCLDPGRFGSSDGFAGGVAALLDRLRATTPVDSGVPVRVAGDPEHAIAVERTRDGIPLARSVVEDIRHVARAAGARFLLPA
jgi:LDH2 family malate/lactate/ureidoglycolate dehydrogenase